VRCYASALYAVVVHPSVCNTLVYCTKTAKRKSVQITPYDSLGTSFLMPKISAKFRQENPQWGRQIEVG